VNVNEIVLGQDRPVDSIPELQREIEEPKGLLFRGDSAVRSHFEDCRNLERKMSQLFLVSTVSTALPLR
jgi:hypothetical protein